MNEPSLNDRKKLYFFLIFNCVLVNLLQNVVRSLLSAAGPDISDRYKLQILIIIQVLSFGALFLWQHQQFMNMGCLSNTVVMATITRYLLEITAHLIDKIC